MNKKTRKSRGQIGWLALAALLAAWAQAASGQGTAAAQGQPGAVYGPLPPATAPITSLPPGPSQIYPVIGAAKGVAAKLREVYTNRPDVKVLDAAGSVVVYGSTAVQQEVGQWLAMEGLMPPTNPPQTLQTVAYSEPRTVVTNTWRLKNLSSRDFETKLTKTWGTSLQSSQDSVGDVATFRFPQSEAGSTSIVVDRRANTATIATPPGSANSWQRLMGILDARSRSESDKTAIIPVNKSDPATMRRAVTLLTQIFGAAETHRRKHVGQFVSMLFQPDATAVAQVAQPGPPAPGPAPAPGGGDIAAQAVAPSGGASAASMEAIARINNVQIEILEDVIVVRGRKEDVDRVLQIIEQIENQSVQFKPEIEIFYLKHIDSTALSDMITQVYNSAFGRLGLVTVTPLQRPNAVLLIGRKENIPALIELISKLDVPAPTEGEFKIFRLQNMSAIDAERTIRTFFVNRPPTDTALRPGLGTRAIVIADYRTNSLIVQAAPRDLIEVSKLLSELDMPSSTVNYEVRVFKLRNAIAETLGPVLEDAITQATATTAAVAGQAGAQGTPPRATPPAVSLQFLRNSVEGQQLIKSGIMSNIRISPDARSNTLIVVGPSSAMDLMAAIIERLDTLPASEAQIKVFGIRNGDATALSEMLQSLFGQQQGAQAQGNAIAPTPSGDSAIVPLRFSVDQRTNSIIASGNAGDLNVIYHILTRLDEGDIRQRTTSVYRLRNAPAQDVATALQQLLQQNLALIQTAPELVTPVETLDRQVIVVPEVVTNSLIVSATSRYYGEISRIIETLDRRPPMVVIQVVLAEVNLDDFEQFGFEWGLQDALMFDRSSSATGNRFNFNGANPTLPNDATAASLATAPRVATQALSNLALGRTDSTLGFGGLVLSASSESVSVLLRALESSSRGQIISRPQVQTLDNLPAFVQVGSLVPRISGVTATNTAVIPVIQDINVGLILQVTPRTSPDGTIVMQVYAEKSVVGPQATAIPIGTDTNGNPILSPQIPRTLAQTTVSARTGQTVILGGLITKDLEETTRRIPYLADIPVLGRLFRFDTARNTRKELLIIMTPYLVTSDEQIEWINARESERMSWCVADIVNIHGPVTMAGNPAFNSAGTPLIFPDMQPGAPTPAVDPSMLSNDPMMRPVYPTGPLPYQAVPQRATNPNDPASPPSVVVPPTMNTPNFAPGYPPGPLPYQEVQPRQPSSDTVPPRQPSSDRVPPPPPGPGLGSSRRTQDDVIVPQPPSLMPQGSSQGSLSPPNIQPAMPPAGTGINSAAYVPQMQWPLPPQQPLPPQGVAPAQYQQSTQYQPAAQYPPAAQYQQPAPSQQMAR